MRIRDKTRQKVMTFLKNIDRDQAITAGPYVQLNPDFLIKLTIWPTYWWKLATNKYGSD